MGTIKVTAHSGCEHTEHNSLAYLRKAVTLPCDVIEIDVREVDGRLWLSHNEITDTKGLVTFEEAVEIVRTKPGVTMNCDLKEDGIFTNVVKRVKELEFFDQTIFTGSVMPFDFPMDESCRKKVYLNIENVKESLSSVTKPEDYTQEDIHYAIKEAATLGANGVNVNYHFANKEMVEYAHELGLKVFVWTVDETEDIKSMMEAGVDSITTYEINKLYELLN